MAVIKRGNVAEPTLPKETVEVEAIGGEVVVRGLLLTERMAIDARIDRVRRQVLADRKDGKSVEMPTFGEVAGISLLAQCVLDGDGVPLWSEEQWQAFGARHKGQATKLMGVAYSLSGFDQDDTAKN